MKPCETLKQYISYFQNKMVMIYNCSDDIAAAFNVHYRTADRPFLLEAFGET